MIDSKPRKFFRLTLKQWLFILLIIPGIPFLLASLAIVLYSTVPWPFGTSTTVPEIAYRTSELVILIHGKGDHPSSWSSGFAAELNSSLLDENQQAIAIDWSEDSTDLFRSTLNGRRIGNKLGRKLAARSNLKHLHLIGHSAGSFVAYGICETIKKNRKDIFVHTTYLDPVSIYAGIDWGYGTRNFGGCADVSDAYIDHDDRVPGSNAPLVHPHTFDVSALKNKAGYTGQPHLWPIAYYRQAVLNHRLDYWRPKAATLREFPPGKCTILR